MEEFLTEHGLILVNGIVSIWAIILIIAVIIAVSNMDAYSLTSIIGS